MSVATTSAFLSREDLVRLTSKVRFKAQCKALDTLGIRYSKAWSGEPLVLKTRLTRRASASGTLNQGWIGGAINQ